MISKAVLALSVLLALGVGGCVKVRPVPAEPKITEHHVPRARDDVFDAAVAVGQRMNLDVPVLEKQSGFLRFEYTNINADRLDRYCQYPYVTKRSGTAFESFAHWNRRAQGEGAPVAGVFQLVLVLSPEGATATNVTVRSRCNVVAPGDSRPKGYRGVLLNECNSLGVLEKEFVDAVQVRLGLH